MEYKEWFLIKTHGNQFQAGLPDWYATHPKFSPKWIETKITGRSFTDAQKKVFPRLIANGVGIWVVEGDDFRGISGKQALHRAYNMLFEPPNAVFFLHHSTRRLFHG